MARRPRRNHSSAFKAKVTVAAIKGEKTWIELAQDFDVHPNQIKQWRDQLLEGATAVFGKALKADPEPIIDVKHLCFFWSISPPCNRPESLLQGGPLSGTGQAGPAQPRGGSHSMP